MEKEGKGTSFPKPKLFDAMGIKLYWQM